MVATAPRLADGRCRPSSSSPGADAVLVAHNAPFDVGFLKAACAATGHEWPGNRVLDTARLARQVVTRDEAPNCKLASLARLFRAGTTPDHRALSDARATVDVLHGLLERLGNLGVRSLDELATFSSRVSPAQRAKRHLAEPLPHLPGVYLFVDERGEVLYVGKAKDLRRRVRSYFTAGETRGRMAEMVGLAVRVDADRLRHPARGGGPRAPADRRSTSRATTGGPASRSGPTGSSSPSSPSRGCPGSARSATTARPTSARSPAPGRSSSRRPRCTRRSGCGSARSRLSPRRPTQRLRARRDGPVRGAVRRHASPSRPTPRTPRPCARRCSATSARSSPRSGRKVSRLSEVERYEEAAVHRDRLAAFVRAAARMQRVSALTGCAEVVAAVQRDAGGWEIVVVRHGRLAGTAVAGRAEDPRRRRRRAGLHRRGRHPRHRPDPGGQRRGDRVRPALARAARRPAGLASPARGPARPTAPAACGCGPRPPRPAARRSTRSGAGATSARSTSPAPSPVRSAGSPADGRCAGSAGSAGTAQTGLTAGSEPPCAGLDDADEVAPKGLEAATADDRRPALLEVGVDLLDRREQPSARGR